MRHSWKLAVLALVALTAACGGKDSTGIVPPDTTGGTNPPPPPPPPPPAGQPVTIFAAGNITTCGTTRDEATARLVDSTGIVFALGDMAFPFGRASDFANCYEPSWGRFKNRTYAAFGNHEYDSSTTAEYARAYFGDRAGTNGKGYYSVEIGAWHVVVLNTGNRTHVDFGGGSEQITWLAADLAANRSRCTMAVFHDPRFFSSTVVGFNERSTLGSLWATLVNGGVDLALSGNQHHYERLQPMDAAGSLDAAAGMTSFNIGTGGESVQTPTAMHPNTANWTTDYGILKVVLKADSFDYQYIVTAGGTASDAGTVACH